MEEADIFSRELTEEAKRFLEKAKKEKSLEGKNAYLHAALLVAFAALEGHINSIADDFLVRRDLTILEQSILSEKTIGFENGEFCLKDQLKMYRLEERIEFIYRRFSGKCLKKDAPWWGKLKNGINLRNRLIHPKKREVFTEAMIEASIQAIIDTLDIIYRAIYKRPYPIAKRRIISSMNF